MTKTQIRTTKRGEKVIIALSVRHYKKLLEDVDELDSIRAYDAAERSRKTPIYSEQRTPGESVKWNP